jgi:hypothetical protein
MKKTGRKKPSPEAEMKAFLASKAVDQISDYSQRGRSYRALSDEQLIESWQAVWNELAADPTNMKTRDDQADLGSEFALRRQEPPWKLVQRQIDIYLEGAERAWEKWRELNPEADAQASEAIDDELEEFKNRGSHSN